MSNGDLSTAKVVILMGSDSDLPRMTQCLSSLDALGVSYDIRVASAHRTPARVLDIVQRAEALEMAVENAGTADAGVLGLNAELAVFIERTRHVCDTARRRVLQG